MRGDEVERMQEEAQEFRDAWDGFVRSRQSRWKESGKSDCCQVFFHGNKPGMSYRGRLPEMVAGARILGTSDGELVRLVGKQSVGEDARTERGREEGRSS